MIGPYNKSCPTRQDFYNDLKVVSSAITEINSETSPQALVEISDRITYLIDFYPRYLPIENEREKETVEQLAKALALAKRTVKQRGLKEVGQFFGRFYTYWQGKADDRRVEPESFVKATNRIINAKEENPDLNSIQIPPITFQSVNEILLLGEQFGSLILNLDLSAADPAVGRSLTPQDLSNILKLFPNLEDLHLSVKDTSPLTTLPDLSATKLKALTLRKIPIAELPKLPPTLESLSLSALPHLTRLTDFSKLSKLTSFAYSANFAQADLRALDAASGQLKYLSLTAADYPPSFHLLQNLETLILIGQKPIDDLSGLPQLKFLTLQGMDTQTESPKLSSPLPPLEKVCITNCEHKDAIKTGLIDQGVSNRIIVI